MAIMRTKSRLTIPAPPPSPIPTGSGSRSAANETFKEFLEKSIQLPHLSLPETRFLSGANPIPAVIDYRSLLSPRGGESVARMFRSAKEFGAFRIINHGISGEEVLSLVNEAKCVFDNSPAKEKEFVQNPIKHNGNREAILQVRYRNGGKTSANSYSVVYADMYRKISEKMENIRSKLEAIGEELSGIFSEDPFLEKEKKEERESILSIYRFNHYNDNFEGNPHPNKDKNSKETDNAEMISLQIPGEHCHFHVNPNGEAPLSFDAAADTIVVTIGKHLQKWSLGRLKSATSNMEFVPNVLGSQASFSIELKFSHPNLLHDGHSKLISISDQILIALLLASLYLLYLHISSLF